MTEQELNYACEWLKAQMHIGSPEKQGNIYFTTFLSVTPDFLDEFRKAMEAVIKDSLSPEFDADYLQSKIDLHTKYMQEHGITSEQQLATLDEMRGREELTWQDVKRIVTIADDIADFDTYRNRHTGEQEYYEEVLHRFNEKGGQ